MGLLTLVKSLFVGQADMVGNATAGRAVTAALRVSARSTGGNGLSWRGAFTTIQDALDAASTNPNDCTLILVAPGAYDINRTGDPTWAANVIIKGSHRMWAEIQNTNAGATSIMRLDGYAELNDLSFLLGTGNNGVILTAEGFRIEACWFDGMNLTGPVTAIHALGVPGPVGFGKITDTMIRGPVGQLTCILLENASCSLIDNVRMGYALAGIQIIGATSDNNKFSLLDVCGCAIGIDIDAGNNQQFDHIHFIGCTRNVDDEVGDSAWHDILGDLPIAILPDSTLAGIVVATAAGANAYGGDTEILAAAARDNPFRIVGIHTEPSAAGWFMVRFSNDNGVTFFDVLLFDATKREGLAAPSGTEYIFNRQTRISASARSDTGNDNVQIWVEIQEI